MPKLVPILLFACLGVCAPFAPVSAQPCTRETLRRVVDETGARLRVLTAETQPKLQTKIRQLKEKRGWTGADGDDKAAAVMSDDRTADFDRKSAGLISRIDSLAEVGEGATLDCSKLGELEAASAELQATIRAKSQHMQARLDEAIGGEPRPATATNGAPDARPVPNPANQAAEPAVQAAPPRKTAEAPKVERPALPTPTQPAAQPKPPRAPNSGWTTETVERRADALPAPATAPPQVPPAGLPPSTVTEDGFSRDEIREASRGFFGTLSGGLATVMEHAFSTLGRPSGYVLGTEGGGAFIAGVRYGQGTLFLRDGSKREVYWHGPSIGYDFGASGSKTLFLVYNLRDGLDIFTGYSGVDGSAYLVGGVGMTLLTDGKVIMAPIRSGVGVRLGANIGYVRFTARPTWNPF